MGVTLKLATSLDGRIATAAGESRWITGEAARETVHRLRAEHDAIVIGVETAIADDPALSVRGDWFHGAQPARVVLDRRQRLPLGGALATSARQTRTYLVTRGELSKDLQAAGVLRVPHAPVDSGESDLHFVRKALAAEGLERLFVEGGGKVAASFLKAGLVDRIDWFRAPLLLGCEGRPAIAELGVDLLAAAPRFRRIFAKDVGGDLWERYERV